MASLEDDDDSADGSSDNDVDETMEDLDDGDADAGGEAEADAENENEDDNEDNDDDDEQDDALFDESPTRSVSRPQQLSKQSKFGQSPSQNGATSTNNGTSKMGGDSRVRPAEQARGTPPSRTTSVPLGPKLPYRPPIRPEALGAITYDIVPTIAAPHSTSINAITATPDMRWVFSGGADGYIRKFNWVDTVNSKSMLTVAQRHPFVDSVTKAGVLMSYWENEEAPARSPANQAVDDSQSLSPVYSLAVHHQALWLLSGLESGGINLQAVRHDEGKRITTLREHTSAVSALVLASDEKSVLSGSWDKTIIDWDLNTGQTKRRFIGSGGQISAIEKRPESSVPVPREPDPTVVSNTLASNNAVGTNGIQHENFKGTENGVEDAHGSPDDSLGSLFGDNDDGGAMPTSGPTFEDDDDDEFSRAIANGIKQQETMDADGDLAMGGEDDAQVLNKDATGPATDARTGGALASTNDAPTSQDALKANGLPHSEELDDQHGKGSASASADSSVSSDNTFLDASIDGTLRIWDRRQPNPISRIVQPRNTPPWCMNACWSHDGNSIYAGRRNGTVDEYYLHKGLREPRRTFRFPGGSGAVSAVRAMPNGRHLVCASYDILRLYDLKDQESTKHSTVPFLIVPGHRTGVVSQLYIDSSCTFMISTAGNRGWEGSSTEVLLGYEIGIGS